LGWIRSRITLMLLKKTYRTMIANSRGEGQGHERNERRDSAGQAERVRRKRCTMETKLATIAVLLVVLSRVALADDEADDQQATRMARQAHAQTGALDALNRFGHKVQDCTGAIDSDARRRIVIEALNSETA
jgi:hypothetical protein